MKFNIGDRVKKNPPVFSQSPMTKWGITTEQKGTVIGWSTRHLDKSKKYYQVQFDGKSFTNEIEYLHTESSLSLV